MIVKKPRSDKRIMQNIWSEMKARCYDHNNKNYKYYGARGIAVCDRWLLGSIYLIEDMGVRPDGLEFNGKVAKYSLDRIDSDGNYCKENCRWADRKTQCRNKRYNNPTVGVNYDKKFNRWEARLRKDGKLIHRETFKSYDEAVISRKKAEQKFLGYCQ